ncbi:MAG: hypothetical protein QM497_03670 [Sulfurimonas sp.]
MKFIESLYIKVFVNIVVAKESTQVYINLYSKDKLTDSFEETFDSTSLNEKMITFIKSYTKETPFFYIAILDYSSEQGAVPTCSRNLLSAYHDMSDCEYKCQDKQWTHYTSKTDLYKIERHYKTIGVDFIFSPFTILSQFFKDKIDGHVSVYLLIQDEFISLSIFQNSKLLYAEYLDMKYTQESEELETVDISEDLDIEEDEGVDLENVTAIEEMDSLDDFGDIEDLDSLDDIEEFDEAEDVEEEFYQEQEEELEEDSEETFNEDYQRFAHVQKSIQNFYEDSKYESQFLENIYIADAVGVTSELKRYFEEELFMSVYIRQIMLSAELGELTVAEVIG